MLDNETTTLLNFFKIFMEMHFLFLFFLNKRDIATSLVMIHFKHAVVSINKLLLNCGPLNMLFHFFNFLFTLIILKSLSKTFWKSYTEKLRKSYKSYLLIANIVKGSVSGRRQFLATKSPWKVRKNIFNCFWDLYR